MTERDDPFIQTHIERAGEGKESEGGVEGHARTCDGPAGPSSEGVTQAGADYTSEQHRVRKEAGIKPGPSDPTSSERVPGLNWELSEEIKKHLAEIDRAIVRPGDPRLNKIICGPNHPTGATPAEHPEAIAILRAIAANDGNADQVAAKRALELIDSALALSTRAGG